MIKKISFAVNLLLLVIGFIVSDLTQQDANETCSWTNTCPVTDLGSYPKCGRTPAVQEQPGVYSAYICGGESPWFGGGSFDLENTYLGKIIKIDVIENRQNYCSQNPSGVGTDRFYAHCACSSGCQIRANYKVFYGYPSQIQEE